MSSGEALSIKLYSEKVKTRDEQIAKRILEYNADDRIAHLIYLKK